MSILIGRETKLITIGFTGQQGTFHSLEARDYGTNFVGGVHPLKGGTIHEGFPIFETVYEAVKKTGANAAMILVPPAQAYDAIMECIEVDLPLVICITEGIPIYDMVKIKGALSGKKTRLIGPNSPGIINPGDSKIGIMPGHIHMPGNVGIVSRSGTLYYEAVFQLTQKEIGQSSCIGIGADPIVGMDFIDILELFEKDPKTDIVLLIGEIGGPSETLAARWIKKNMKKPVVSFLAGASAPKAKRMGHAGAFMMSNDESVESKMKILEECGVFVVRSPAEMGTKVQEILSKVKK